MTEYMNSLLASIDARKSYELAKNVENTSMQSTLNAMRKTASREVIASFMSDCNVDANFINKSERSNARFNVYAAEKVFNVAQSALKATSLNHYAINILKSAIALEAKELFLTHDDAQSACSLSVKSRDAKREKLISKYQKHVAKSTASTQASSSIASLLAFDVLREARDESNVTIYKLNRDALAFAKLV